MRHQTGLRNKYRSGRSTYNVRNKSVGSDSYGQWSQGTQVRAERIAGHTLTRTRDAHGDMQWTSSEAVKVAINDATARGRLSRSMNFPL